jgi:hypothetical protein
VRGERFRVLLPWNFVGVYDSHGDLISAAFYDELLNEKNMGLVHTYTIFFRENCIFKCHK